jgi:hypothetical protein
MERASSTKIYVSDVFWLYSRSAVVISVENDSVLVLEYKENILVVLLFKMQCLTSSLRRVN